MENFEEFHARYIAIEREMDALQSEVIEKEQELNELRNKLDRIKKEYRNYKDVVLAFLRITST